MALFLWPHEYIPHPGVSFASNIGMPSYRSTMSSGKTRQRNKLSSELSFYNATWSLTDLQRGEFQAIVKVNLRGGSDWFEILLPVNSGMELVTARFVDGKLSETYEDTMYWSVSATLECKGVPTVTEVELDALLMQLESEGC